MKILFAYTTRNGTAAECARIFAEYVGSKAEVTLLNLKESGEITLYDYDAVVLGGSVRFGKISKQLKGFIKDNIELLNKTASAAFLCCGFPDEFDDYVSTEFRKDFIPKYGFHCFGGELKPKKAKGIDRLLIKALRSSVTQHDFEDASYKGALPEILPEAIYRLADRIVMG
ncbi:MAG: hypothetical protein E7641_06405 [Ruminococcaceae bacterium]|nr:hypothetical protein [Oscillospiraceae bacterium]